MYKQNSFLAGILIINNHEHSLLDNVPNYLLSWVRYPKENPLFQVVELHLLIQEMLPLLKMHLFLYFCCPIMMI